MHFLRYTVFLFIILLGGQGAVWGQTGGIPNPETCDDGTIADPADGTVCCDDGSGMTTAVSDCCECSAEQITYDKERAKVLVIGEDLADANREVTAIGEELIAASEKLADLEASMASLCGDDSIASQILCKAKTIDVNEQRTIVADLNTEYQIALGTVLSLQEELVAASAVRDAAKKALDDCLAPCA